MAPAVAKKKPAPPDPAAALAKEIAALETKLGKGMIHPAATQSPVNHLPFLNPHLNYATEGGAPWDRVVALYGDESAGKAVALDTPIPTPSGWTTMGQIEVGDLVFDEKGQPTRVTYTSPVFVDHDCYRIEFDDGTHITADAEHRWMTSTYLSRQATVRSERRVPVLSGDQNWQSPQPLHSVVTTDEIASSVLWGAQGHHNHAIHNAAPLQLPVADLPIDPYTLGVWLGDGTSSAAEYTGIDEEISWHIQAAGYEVRRHDPPNRCTKWSIIGLRKQLVKEALLNNKHIPDRYLRASASQRIALLQGLMDTDGHITRTGHCEFTGTRKGLVEGVCELICSLGMKARMTESRSRLNGQDMGPKWRISFRPDLHVFRLRRKIERAVAPRGRARTWRKIVACHRVDSVPTRCLQVESESHLFLIGHQMIVTHNTLCALELVVVAQSLPYSAERLLVPRIAYHRGHGHTIEVERLTNELDWIKASFPEGARCLWHDIEGQFDKIRAQRLGVDTDALYMSEFNIIEEIGMVLPFGYKNFHIQVLDSTSAASSLLSLKQDPGKSLVGTDARQWKAVLRDSMTHFGPSKNDSGIPNLLVMIHQMSTNVRSGGAQAMTTRFLRHTSSCSIRFTRGAFLWNKDGVLKDGKTDGADDSSMAGIAEPDGLEVFAKIDKSRACRPFRVASMQFSYKTLRYTPIHELATSGLYFGIIAQSGAWYTVDGDPEDVKAMQGMKRVYVRLADDEALRDRIMCRLMDTTDES